MPLRGGPEGPDVAIRSSDDEIRSCFLRGNPLLIYRDSNLFSGMSLRGGPQARRGNPVSIAFPYGGPNARENVQWTFSSEDGPVRPMGGAPKGRKRSPYIPTRASAAINVQANHGDLFSHLLRKCQLPQRGSLINGL